MSRFLIGIDEVGRGPLAGPVAVCAFCLKEEILEDFIKEIFGSKIRDSKKMTKKKREEIAEIVTKKKKEGLLDFKISTAEASVIDKYGINPSIKKSLEKSILGLDLDPKSVIVFLDGGLRAPDIFINQETIIKGDSSNALIATASILAKVYRDSLMVKYAQEYTQYKFEKNMGYGTKAHIDALRETGISPIHRVSYLKNL
ncbi:MAG: ribonuclease HII [Candidatus Pacebacteria bacterium]|jgi:ribonuclease HII|nr:ribonuclease HII [Candidatus Paceibacterota bacterium]